MKNAESTKARLKNIANKNGKTMQDVLISYGLERTILRISKSEHKNNFTLKGGIFLYALLDGEFARATTDIDLLAQGISNDVEKMKNVFTDIFSMECDDPLRFDIETMNVKNITEFKEYHGVNIYIDAYLDRTKIPVSIDIGFGDVIYPKRVMMEFPVILSDEKPKVYAYSLSSSVAEKFEAMVSLGYDNSRFKDFYDIYILSNKYNFDGTELMGAIKETFKHRNTSLDDIVIFDADFAEDSIRQSRWKSFAKKKKIMLDISLEETINGIKYFIIPIVEAIKADDIFKHEWNCKDRKWK